MSADLSSVSASPGAASAYLLVSHGSRDPRPQVAIEQLARQISEQTGLLVEAAVLELGPLPLHQQIQQFAERAKQAGYGSVKLLPLFLLQGVHVMEDIPMQVELAQQQLKDRVRLEVCPHLGSHPQLWKLLLSESEQAETDSPVDLHKILIAHGSRRPGGQTSVEAAAAQLKALPAYWSIAPGLETQVSELVKQGVQQIVILPYFLFEGGITDALAQTVEQLGQQFPQTQLRLNRPFGAMPEQVDQLADLALDLLKQPA